MRDNIYENWFENQKKSYEPKGIKFFDAATDREMILVSEGPYKDWLCYKAKNGNWVTLRIATDEDKKAIDYLKRSL